MFVHCGSIACRAKTLLILINYDVLAGREARFADRLERTSLLPGAPSQLLCSQRPHVLTLAIDMKFDLAQSEFGGADGH